MEKNRIIELDYIKTLMIIFVIITHINFSNQERKIYLFNFYINLAIPVFMIISGFLCSQSFQKQQTEKIYNFRYILKKIIRFLPPFLFISIIEYFIYYNFNIALFIKFLLLGGYGPGSYYTPIVFQFIFIFPLILSIFKFLYNQSTNPLNIYPIIYFFSLDILYNFLATLLNMPTAIYRLLIFRYLGFISIGIYFYFLFKGKQKIYFYLLNNKKIKITKILLYYMISFILSFIFIFNITFNNYTPIIYNKSWASVGLPTASFVVFLLFMLYLFFQKLIKFSFINKINKFIILISNSTYHIYLIQMFYYNFSINQFFTIQGQFLFNTIICVFGGISIYLLEQILFKLLNLLYNKVYNLKLL